MKKRRLRYPKMNMKNDEMRSTGAHFLMNIL